MSKASQKRVLEPILPPEGLSFWRASSYRVAGGYIEAEPGAAWVRETPRYVPPDKVRGTEGPHLLFARLKSALAGGGWEDLAGLHGGKSLALFALAYGMLGLMHEGYVTPPIPPPKKPLIAADAVLEADGTLRRIDPVSEGAELVLEIAERRRGARDWEVMLKRRGGNPVNLVAMPSEVAVLPRKDVGPWPDPYRPERRPVAWDAAAEPYGARLIPDETSPTGVGVLPTREPVIVWWRALEDFPPATDGKYDTGDPGLKRYLNSRLTEVSPYSPMGDEGLRRGWRCATLFQAIHLMLWLDLTGGRTIRECELRDCSRYFREGSQPGARYCSPEHTSLSTTRKYLGRRA